LGQSNKTRDLGIIIDNKLNFNSYVSAVAHKAHVRASLILRTFVSRDIDILTKAFTTYVRSILEYGTYLNILPRITSALDENNFFYRLL